jgi:hypothetical protein
MRAVRLDPDTDWLRLALSLLSFSLSVFGATIGLGAMVQPLPTWRLTAWAVAFGVMLAYPAARSGYLMVRVVRDHIPQGTRHKRWVAYDLAYAGLGILFIAKHCGDDEAGFVILLVVLQVVATTLCAIAQARQSIFRKWVD